MCPEKAGTFYRDMLFFSIQNIYIFDGLVRWPRFNLIVCSILDVFILYPRRWVCRPLISSRALPFIMLQADIHQRSESSENRVNDCIRKHVDEM